MKPIFFHRQIELLTENQFELVGRIIMQDSGTIYRLVYLNVWQKLFENNPYRRGGPPMGPEDGIITEFLLDEYYNWRNEQSDRKNGL